MARFKVGVQLHPQATTVDEMRAAWKAADALGVDSIWTWDHFYPLYGDPTPRTSRRGRCWRRWPSTPSRRGSACSWAATRTATPTSLADMARTVDHLSGGRLYLGHRRRAGSSATTTSTATSSAPRWAACARSVRRCRAMKARLGEAEPAARRDRCRSSSVAAGEKVTLRLVAEHADAWNTFGPPESYAHKNAVLDEWCEKVGRDPAAIERTVAIGARARSGTPRRTSTPAPPTSS